MVMEQNSNLGEQVEEIAAGHHLTPVDMTTATSKIQIEASEVRNPINKPNWTSYLRSQLVPQNEYNFIVSLEAAKNKAERSEVLNKDRLNTAKCIINLVTEISKEQLIRYVLTVFDDLLQEDKSRVEIFHEYAFRQRRTIWSWFQGILTRNDCFIVNQMSTIFAKLACFGPVRMEGQELHTYFNFLRMELRNTSNEYINTSVRCLQMMLRIEVYRNEFVQCEGVPSILTALDGRTNFQLQYQLIFCLWCLSFDCKIARYIQSMGIIQTLGDILSECSKEKVVRIILHTFRNLLEKIDSRELVRESALQMVQCKTLKTLELMDAKKFDDEDLLEDIEFLSERLHTSVQDLSSFDEYCTEIRSGRLHWSPVHKSEKFWRENAQRFNEKNFELIKMLIRLLESNDVLVLCVAAHDIGEYVRHFPRGKDIVEQYQGKQAVMKLLSAEDPNVRYHALLAIQKLMVHNWEYLGKQLDVSENNKGGIDDNLKSKD
ncbi:V-type proton ATPase subunit H [Meloidogyne graminicola]|uniref:V-type proton ATPase subunit H n=1 Tax=Meloidogyne graminicola TaxID=189291 RepID=A0A8S9ZY61_9BILA|nr:V-type proton ATPase subunit H [Meloidogyne graminicola]